MKIGLLYFIQNLMKVKIVFFYREVILRIALVVFSIMIVLYPLDVYLIEKTNFLLFIFKTLIITILTISFIIAIGMNKMERQFLKTNFQNYTQTLHRLFGAVGRCSWPRTVVRQLLQAALHLLVPK